MRVGVIFGGRSCEHDISIITGVMTVNAAMERHVVTPIYIDGDGVWYTGRGFNSVDTFAEGRYKKKRVHLRPSSSGVYTRFGRRIARLDAVIVCCHGLNGEDGTLAGLLEMSGIPYAGSGVLASAVGMDKIVQKMLLLADGIVSTPFVGLEKEDMANDFYDKIGEIKSKLTFPLMVKPANLGSSIGIGRAGDFRELFLRLREAFEWDNRVIVENALSDFTEVNCAVLGSGDKLIVSQIEQPLSSGFLSFSDKYERVDGKNDGGEEASTESCVGGGKGDCGRFLPAHISPEMAERVRETAKRVFRLLGCSGVARVDFLIADDVLYVNEINTVPGSMSSYLFAFDGMDFPLLIDKLLFTALEKYRSRDRLRLRFDSNVLKNKKINKK